MQSVFSVLKRTRFLNPIRKTHKLTPSDSKSFLSYMNHKIELYNTTKDFTINDYINRYSRIQPGSISVQQFLDFAKDGNEKISMNFLTSEIPIRIANILKELYLLPEEIINATNISIVHDWYKQSMTELISYQTKSSLQSNSHIDRFYESLEKIYNRHANVVEMMATGIIQLRNNKSNIFTAKNNRKLQYFFDRFYLNRIGIRMLISQHLALYDKSSAKAVTKRYLGCFDSKCEIYQVIQDAITTCSDLCYQTYAVEPSFKFKWVNCDETLSFVYVSCHVYHVVFELLKNACRATVEKAEQCHTKPPPITIILSKGKEDLSISIRDEGNGMSREILDNVFLYLFSTAPHPHGDTSVFPAMAGYGFGLPLSRIYAKYFGGDLHISSIEGHETMATVWLKLKASEANEVQPDYNKTTKSNYMSVIAVEGQDFNVHHD